MKFDYVVSQHMAYKQGQIRWREKNDKMKALRCAADGMAGKENIEKLQKADVSFCYIW